MSIRMGRKEKNNTGILFVSKDRRTKVYATQPRPTFFSVAEIARMDKQPGSYKYGEGVRK